jgi:tetratricopeptide (TPR) repeat protein
MIGYDSTIFAPAGARHRGVAAGLFSASCYNGRQVGKRARRATKAPPAAAESIAATAVRPRDGRRDRYVYLLLFLVTCAVYSQVRHFAFVNFDDPEYIGGNNHVRAGLTWDGLAWAFTSTSAANWFPLTWISHMAAFQLFGMDSGWHHLINVLFHALASLLLLAALQRMTGALWPSAFVAFLFALHPLHVESVAWIAERKDVLSAFFWCLTLWCYARYVQQPSALRYWFVALAFAGGLMSKSMIVTLPFILLLLDLWPLRRTWRLALLREKLPLVALAAAVSLLTLVSQRQGHAIRSLASLPFGVRLANAVWTYVVYIGRMFWPTKLAVYYPYSHHLPFSWVAAAGAALAGVTVLVVRWFRRYPYLAVGWFWYLGTLLPVIGLVQVGGQSSADRYTYLPTVGLTIMLAWGGVNLLKRYPQARKAVVTAAVAAVCICLALTARQVGYWANSGTLFQHAVAVTTGNYVAENNLADYYLTQMRTEEARGPVLEALRYNPDYPEAHVNMATILRRTGQMSESEEHYQEALRIQPINVEAHAGYGALLLQEGRAGDALREFERVVELRPEDADAHYDLGRVLAAVGRGGEAMAQFSETIRLRPDDAEAHHSLAVALAGRGRFNEALGEFAAEARLKPGDAGVHANLAMMLASVGRLDEAIAQYSQALRIKPDFAAARKGLEAVKARRAK